MMEMEMAVDLPKELVVDILLRLPVESMMRLKSVCKSWYALFKDPSFVSRHLANQSKDHLVFYNGYHRGEECNISSIISSGSGSGSGSDGDDIVYYDVDLPPSYKDSIMLVVGHCDGIVAMTHHRTHPDTDDDVTVCNFATREFRTLPHSSFHPYPKHHWGPPARHAETDTVGFGYDHKTKDYKVVRVVAFWQDMERDLLLHSRVEVFSLGTDSCWREINSLAAANIGAYSKFEHMERYLDGVWYWWGHNNDVDYDPLLVSFNFADEVFRKASLPDICDSRRMIEDYNDINLGVYNSESIALFVYTVDPEGSTVDKCIHVWITKELFGVKESWIKQLSIGPFKGLVRPLAFWKNDTHLLYEDPNKQLVSCDLVTLDFKTFPCYGCLFNRAFAVKYMETLVSVNTRDRRTTLLQLDA